MVLLFILHFICPDPNVLFPFGFRLPKAKEKMQPLVMTKKPLIDLFPKYVVDWRTRWALNPRAENE